MWLSECYILLFFVVVFSVLGLVVTILVILIIYGAPSCRSLEYKEQRYKDMFISSLSLSLSLSLTHTHTHTHTHTNTTNTCITGVGLAEWEERKPQISTAQEKRWVFSSDLNEESEDKHWQREEGSSRSQVQCIGRISPHGSSCPPEQHGKAEYPRLSKESKKENRNEATQVWRSCTRECGSSWVILYWIWLLTGSQWRS